MINTQTHIPVIQTTDSGPNFSHMQNFEVTVTNYGDIDPELKKPGNKFRERA